MMLLLDLFSYIQNQIIHKWHAYKYTQKLYRGKNKLHFYFKSPVNLGIKLNIFMF
jgi:hypothetical protein